MRDCFRTLKLIRMWLPLLLMKYNLTRNPKTMKHLLLATLLTCSPLIYANTVTNQCPQGEGQITSVLDDTTIQAGTKLNVKAQFTLLLHDWAYPQTAFATENAVICFDNVCRDMGNSPSLPVLPGGLNITDHFPVVSPTPMTTGTHWVTFRMYVPEYDCSATAAAKVTVV